MSPLLAFFILILGCCYSSSASILKTKKQGLEELSPTKSPIGSPVASPTSGATLSGYISTTFHSDSLCRTPLATVFYSLNKCFRTSVNEYTFITATSSSVLSVEYSDSLCKVATNSTLTLYSDGACLRKSKVSASSTSTLIPDVTNAVARSVST